MSNCKQKPIFFTKREKRLYHALNDLLKASLNIRPGIRQGIREHVIYTLTEAELSAHRLLQEIEEDTE